MCEAHPSALTPESSVRETGDGAVQARGAKRVCVGTREGAHLSICAKILVGPEGTALRLAMGGEAGLRKRRCGAESP